MRYENEAEIYSQRLAQALKNLADALALHFTPPVATLNPKVRPLQVDLSAA